MKKKPVIPDRPAVWGGLLALLLTGLCALCFRQDFSGWERRYLTGLPQTVSLTGWTLDDDLEAELSDQIPGRRQLVSLYAQAQALTGRSAQLDAWPLKDAFLEKPVSGSVQTARRRVEQMKALAGDVPCLFLTPPTHGMLRMDEMSALRRAVYEEEEVLYQQLTGDGAFVPLRDAFLSLAAQPSQPLYYRTDHHWTLYGAYLAYRQYCAAAGLEPAAMEEFTVSEYAPFYGTTYSRSGLPFARADTLVCAEPKANVLLTLPGEELTADHLIFPEEAETYDGYAVYLKGNHGLTEIVTADAQTDQTLLIFKDSFANCLIPFLTRHYARIIAADARYMDGSFRDVLEKAGRVDRILYLYSLDSLVNDTSITRKLR